jgi:uncharacterized membrane protein
MRARFRSWWYGIEGSLWFLPAVLTAAAVLLAVLTVRLDQTLLLDRRAEVEWLFGGGVEGARGVLEAFAGTMVTVTALVFSITVVALQLAASQLSPRVLRAFMGDRGNQVVLGFFIGTFTYALLVLRTVRSPLDVAEAFVPALSVTVAIALTLLSVALLIFFIHHAADAMRASVVIDRAAATTRGLIDSLYPDDVGAPAPSAPPAWLECLSSATVCAEGSGYLQGINADALFALAEDHALTLRPVPLVGDFVLPGAPLAAVWPADALDDDVAHAVRAALVLGPERTLQADVAFGFQQLGDIAVKALSPGINDPTTATICVDRLGALLVHLANRVGPNEVRSGEDGSVRLVLPGPSFARLVGIAFDPIRHYGASDPTVAEHLLATLGGAAALVPAARRDPVLGQARIVLAAARTQIALAEDREQVAQAGAWVAAYATDRRDAEGAYGVGVPVAPPRV